MKIPIYILSGFLGAGKTTLLRNILLQEKKQDRKVAVLMNELGEISIDSDAVDGETPLKELLNGCVCCTIQGQLEAQLQELIHLHNLDAIYIETTGVAHPIEVVDACMSPILVERINVESVISLIDAKRWKDRKTLSPQLQSLLIEQVKHADVLLLNKVDELTDEVQGQLAFEIQQINPYGKLLFTTFASVNLLDLQGIQRKPREDHEKLHVDLQLRLKTLVYKFTKPVDHELFEDWLRSMPDSVYRIKGYIRFTHSDSLYLFQYSYGMPLYMKELMNIPTNLVFIGEHLPVAEMRQQLAELESASQTQ
ncbi:G3E family GTPase [Bacillus mesophilus]|uniref:GTP-binding protein n=1 Tax=Bacillus mesophilus TaxID=1808955 RepID=A0A6M0QCY5_9BACI|nr:GTP-binding protein [Bacillus mesophilus]MBM7663072.1 G3E family GTPase [Bacillus mesophilus]NEY73609.1 GTP-binding protein [Bacillus mesophilus]